MAATNKDELSRINQQEFVKLEGIIGPIDEKAAMIKDADGVSIKDIVAHRAHWIDLFLGWYSDGLAGDEVFFPAKGYKWNELPRYNADLRAAQKEMDWASAQAMLKDRHAKLLDFIQSTDEDGLYGGSMNGAKNEWTPGRWAEAAGPSHYRSATKYIRKRLKAGA